MSKNHSEALGTDALDLAQMVSAYLRTHPDFFLQHVDLLTELAIPHPSGGATSLIERQVQVLQERNRQLHNKHQEFLSNARDSESLSQLLHALSERLVQAHRIDAAVEVLQTSLRDDFRVEHVSLRIFSDLPVHGDAPSETFLAHTAPTRGLFDTVFAAGRPICGRLRAQHRAFFFGSGSDGIASAVLIPLNGPAWQGVLTLASSDPRRYYAGMGVDLMVHLGDLASLALNSYFTSSVRREP